MPRSGIGLDELLEHTRHDASPLALTLRILTRRARSNDPERGAEGVPDTDARDAAGSQRDLQVGAAHGRTKSQERPSGVSLQR